MSLAQAHAETGVDSALARAMSFLERFQTPSGSLRAPYDGPLFLTPGFVIARFVAQRPFDAALAERLLRAIGAAQNPDGGFGLHVEGDSSLFSTVMNYVALRLLGMGPGAEVAARARGWIHAQGGAIRVPSWGKYWLALLRLYEWEGVHPVLPELLLLPRWFPLHPARIWCHARAIYLALAYLYGRRWRVCDSPLLAALRRELYAEDYAAISFARHRDSVAEVDLYVRPSWALRAINRGLALADRLVPARLRQHALAAALAQIRHGLRSTSHIDLGPVNKALDVIVCWAEEPRSLDTRRGLERMADYLFDGDLGLSVQAYNSSEVWDTALGLQSIAAAAMPGAPVPSMARRACAFLQHSQIMEDVRDREAHFRDPSRGGWPFSTREHGWPIVDCTAQALMALLRFEVLPQALLPAQNRLAAIDLLLHWQNSDGGWPTYERCRGGPFLERLNPSQMFGGVMVDGSAVELTSAALQGLAQACTNPAEALDGERRSRVERALRRGTASLRAGQRADGSWKGSWGICYTYGTWFGIWGLRASGVPASDSAIGRARDFLLANQRADGGWGESFRGCSADRYVEHPDGSQPAMTAWAMLALLSSAGAAARAGVERGAGWLVRSQAEDGDWPQRGVTGVFNHTCMLNYRLYRSYFPIWALGLARAADRCRP